MSNAPVPEPTGSSASSNGFGVAVKKAPKTVPQSSAAFGQHKLATHKLQLHVLDQDNRRRSLPLPYRLHCLTSPSSMYQYAASEGGDQADAQAREQLVSEHAQAAYTRAIKEETTKAPVPQDTDVPKCDCGVPAELMEYYPEGEDAGTSSSGKKMWVCEEQTCMFFKTVKSANVATSIPEGDEIQGMLEEAPRVNDDQSYVHGWNEDEIDEQAEAPNLLELSVTEFWESIRFEMVKIDEEMLPILMTEEAVAEAPVCMCDRDVTLVQSKISGDLFWACSEETCKFMKWAFPCPAPDPSQLFDFGTDVQLGGAVVDRYCTDAYVLRSFGKSFSHKFFVWLSKAKLPSDEFPKGSHQMEAGEEYDMFVSYRGGMGRFWIWTALCAQLNMKPAAVVLLLAMPVMVLLIYSWMPEPCYTTNDFLLGMLSCTKYCDDLTDTVVSNPTPQVDVNGDLLDTVVQHGTATCSVLASPWPAQRIWFLFVPYGSILLIAVVWFWHPVTSWWRRSSRIFMDKYCVHQSDIESQQVGLCRMPLYLRSSKSLLCVFDDHYASRLWCIFELAVYIRLRELPKVVFINASQRLLEIVLITIKLAEFVLICFAQRFASESSQPDKFGRAQNSPGAWFTYYRYISNVFVKSFAFLLCQRHFRELITLRETIRTFDVRQTQLAQASDKPFLLQFINHFYGPDIEGDGAQAAPDAAAGQATGLDMFNVEVRARVPRQLPVSGVRSWVMFSYIAVLVYGATAALIDYDCWSYHKYFDDEFEILSHHDTLENCYGLSEGLCLAGATLPGSNGVAEHIWGSEPNSKWMCRWDEQTSRCVYNITPQEYERSNIKSIYWQSPTQGLTSILSLASKVFILVPISMFILSSEIRLFLNLQKWTKLPYWWSVAVFLPVFLILETVFKWRQMLFFNLTNLVSLSVGSDNVWTTAERGHWNEEGSAMNMRIAPYNRDWYHVGGFVPIMVWKNFWGIETMLSWYVGRCTRKYSEWTGHQSKPYTFFCALGDQGDGSGSMSDLPEGETISTINLIWQFAFPFKWWMVLIIWITVIIPSVLMLLYVYNPLRVCQRFDKWCLKVFGKSPSMIFLSKDENELDPLRAQISRQISFEEAQNLKAHHGVGKTVASTRENLRRQDVPQK